MTRLHRWWLPALLVSAFTVAGACGDDDGGDDKPSMDGGTDGGQDASADGSTRPPDASTDAGVQGVVCGSVTCSPYSSLSPALPPPAPCCYNGPLADGTTATNVCSGMLQGMCLPPAVDDTRCDDLSVVGMTLQGCCALNGQCGVNSNATGLGCPDLQTTEATIKGLVPTFSFPASSKRACNASDAGIQLLTKVGLDAGL